MKWMLQILAVVFLFFNCQTVGAVTFEFGEGIRVRTFDRRTSSVQAIQNRRVIDISIKGLSAAARADSEGEYNRDNLHFLFGATQPRRYESIQDYEMYFVEGTDGFALSETRALDVNQSFLVENDYNVDSRLRPGPGAMEYVFVGIPDGPFEGCKLRLLFTVNKFSSLGKNHASVVGVSIQGDHPITKNPWKHELTRFKNLTIETTPRPNVFRIRENGGRDEWLDWTSESPRLAEDSKFSLVSLPSVQEGASLWGIVSPSGNTYAIDLPTAGEPPSSRRVTSEEIVGNFGEIEIRNPNYALYRIPASGIDWSESNPNQWPYEAMGEGEEEGGLKFRKIPRHRLAKTPGDESFVILHETQTSATAVVERNGRLWALPVEDLGSFYLFQSETPRPDVRIDEVERVTVKENQNEEINNSAPTMDEPKPSEAVKEVGDATIPKPSSRSSKRTQTEPPPPESLVSSETTSEVLGEMPKVMIDGELVEIRPVYIVGIFNEKPAAEPNDSGWRDFKGIGVTIDQNRDVTRILMVSSTGELNIQRLSSSDVSMFYEAVRSLDEQSSRVVREYAAAVELGNRHVVESLSEHVRYLINRSPNVSREMKKKLVEDLRKAHRNLSFDLVLSKGTVEAVLGKTYPGQPVLALAKVNELGHKSPHFSKLQSMGVNIADSFFIVGYEVKKSLLVVRCYNGYFFELPMIEIEIIDGGIPPKSVNVMRQYLAAHVISNGRLDGLADPQVYEKVQSAREVVALYENAFVEAVRNLNLDPEKFLSRRYDPGLPEHTESHASKVLHHRKSSVPEKEPPPTSTSPETPKAIATDDSQLPAKKESAPAIDRSSTPISLDSLSIAEDWSQHLIQFTENDPKTGQPKIVLALRLPSADDSKLIVVRVDTGQLATFPKEGEGYKGISNVVELGSRYEDSKLPEKVPGYSRSMFQAMETANSFLRETKVREEAARIREGSVREGTPKPK